MIYIDENNKLNLSNLHENQKAFIASKHLHTGIVGGYQSGKSTVAVIKCIIHLLMHPNVPIAYYLPTYGLFEDMLLPKLKTLLGELNIPFTYNQKNSKITTSYGEIWMRSMDNPDRIVSYSVGYSVVDEVDLVHPNKRNDAMKRISSRNSYKKATDNQIDFVSTPEGFAYMYQFFEKKANDNKLLLRLSTLDNEDNLAGGYIQGLREQYTVDQLKAYLKGEFVNLTSGTVHYKFDRFVNDSNRNIKEHDTLYVGMDFNIGNMSAVIHVVDEIPIAVDEITKAYDTVDICKILKEKYKGHRIIVYPDASGKSRKSSASQTDIEIIKEYDFQVRAKDSNPPVDDRIKNMNRMFCDGNNKIGYKVNTTKCTEYAESLERLAYDKNGNPDKSSGFDHLCECGGYFIYYEYPLRQLLIPPIIYT